MNAIFFKSAIRLLFEPLGASRTSIESEYVNAIECLTERDQMSTIRCKATNVTCWNFDVEDGQIGRYAQIGRFELIEQCALVSIRLALVERKRARRDVKRTAVCAHVATVQITYQIDWFRLGCTSWQSVVQIKIVSIHVLLFFLFLFIGFDLMYDAFYYFQ